MATEIERRFLVADAALCEGRPGQRLTQGYLCRDPGRTVRVRLAVDEAGGERAWLTVKGPSRLELGALVRAEWELELEPGLARQWLGLCLPALVEKTRHRIGHAGHVWELDVFHGENAGLVLAEVELSAPGEAVDLPPWLGQEISHDGRYHNAALSERPWRAWPRA